MRRFPTTLLLFLLATPLLPADPPAPNAPRLVGHRGLIRHAPENTLAGFSACLDLRVGFELDVRRTKDGQLVCLHDADLKRTTGTAAKLADLTLAEVKKLDAGSRFDPAFAGERVPTLEEVFALLGERKVDVLVALDLKEESVEADVVRLAKKHEVLGKVVCIGRAIENPAVRRNLHAADPKAPAARLAKSPDDLPAVLADPDADWAYVRFLPTPEQVAKVHAAGKRIFLAGPLVAGREPDNWLKARTAGVDAILTDYPLDCRAAWRTTK